MSEEDKVEQPIIVKKIKKGGGHHGGAWKVAYADFVTAMMAFFLLLWLLNVSTDEQKNAISNYFDPTHPSVSRRESGAGGVLGGLSVAPEGAMVTNVQHLTNPTPTGDAGTSTDSKKQTIKKGYKGEEVNQALEDAKNVLRAQEEERMKKAMEAIEQAIAEDKELNALKDQLIVDMTPEGLRIQVIDKDGKPMFASGSARMFDKTQKLLKKVGEIIQKMPNELSIRGHTDSVPYAAGANYTNWELSADRANSSRRVLLDAGLPAERINNVVGKADTEHLLQDDPTNASNRRISITLLKEELTNPDFDKKAAAMIKKPETEERQPVQEQQPEEESYDDILAPPNFPKMGTFKKTPGKVEFP